MQNSQLLNIYLIFWAKKGKRIIHRDQDDNQIHRSTNVLRFRTGAQLKFFYLYFL